MHAANAGRFKATKWFMTPVLKNKLTSHVGNILPQHPDHQPKRPLVYAFLGFRYPGRSGRIQDVDFSDVPSFA